MRNKPIILFVMFLLFGGCDTGGDPLSELVPAFSLQREDLNEAKQLIQTLAVTEGISQFKAGILYNDTPDRVRYQPDSPLEPLETISLKDLQSKAKLERLRVVARKLSCHSVSIDELSRVWVITYYGKDVYYGYAFFDPSGGQTPKDGDYLEIPGEKKWHAFSR